MTKKSSFEKEIYELTYAEINERMHALTGMPPPTSHDVEEFYQYIVASEFLLSCSTAETVEAGQAKAAEWLRSSSHGEQLERLEPYICRALGEEPKPAKPPKPSMLDTFLAGLAEPG